MIHSLQEYQECAVTFVTYRRSRNRWEYLACGINGEAGEAAEKLKKVHRGDKVSADDIYNTLSWPEDVIRHTLLELGDVLWYAIIIAWESHLPIDEGSYYGLVEDQQRKSVYHNACRLNALCAQLSEIILDEDWEESYDNTFMFDERSNTLSVIFKIICMVEMLAESLWSSILEVATLNIDKLSSRAERGKLKGSGDDR